MHPITYNNEKQGGVGCSTDMMETKMQQNRRKLLMPKCKLDDKLDSTIDWEKAIWYKCTSYLSQTLSMHIICWGPGLDCVKLNSLHKLYQNRESLMVCMGVIRTDGRLQDGYKPFQLIWITNGTRPGQDQGPTRGGVPLILSSRTFYLVHQYDHQHWTAIFWQYLMG